MTLNASFVNGSPSRTTVIVAIVPLLESCRSTSLEGSSGGVGVADATPSIDATRRATALTSSGVTGPSSLATMIVVGYKRPAGNASSSSSNPSTDSTDFLKNVVVE